MKKIKLFCFVFILLSLILYLLGPHIYSRIDGCGSLEKVADNSEYIEKMKSVAALIAQNHELKFNLFLSQQLDPEEFKLIKMDWAAAGIDSERVKFRFDAPHGQYEKTVEKIESISILLDRCCILKIPMKDAVSLALSENEKKFQKQLKNKKLYFSCKFELIN